MRFTKTALVVAMVVGIGGAFSAGAQQTPSVVFKPGAKPAIPAYKRQAIGHMNAGRFQEAYDILKANLEANQGDIDTRFMLGQCASRINKPDEALALYQGILAENPDLPRVRLEMARAYMALGQNDKAREAFEAVQATNPPPVVGENIQRFLDSIAAQRPWQARLALSYVVDTNVNTGPGSTTALDPTVTWTGVTGRRDTAWGMNGGFSYTHALNQSMALQFEFNAFSLDYQSENDSDQLIASVSAGPTWKVDDFVVSLPAILDHTEVGHDYYNHTYGLAPQVRYNMNRDQSITGTVAVSRRQHRSLSPDRDGYAFGLNLAFRQQLGNGSFLQPGLRLGREVTQVNWFDTNSAAVSLGWFTRLPWDMSLYVQPSIGRIVKTEPDPLYAGLCSGCDNSQMDWQYQLTANLNKPLDKKGTNLSVGATLTRNDSTVALTDYHKAMLTVMLSSRF